MKRRSPPDGLADTGAKTGEYREIGVRWGWLVAERRVHVCRPGPEVGVLDAPLAVTAGAGVLRRKD